MVQYEENRSPFYLAHKEFCGQMEAECLKRRGTAEGSCHAFGYFLKLCFSKGNLRVEMTLKKQQTTQSGRVVAKDSNEYKEVRVYISGISKDIRYRLGKSVFRRLFFRPMSTVLQFPYYEKAGSALHPNQLETIRQIVCEYAIEEIRILDGKLMMLCRQELKDPFAPVDAMIQALD